MRTLKIKTSLILILLSALLWSGLSIAQTAPVDPGQKAVSYMQSIINMPYDEDDLAHRSLGRLFGGFIFEPFGKAPDNPPTVLAIVLGYTNVIAMLLGVIITGYVIMAGALNTAASGEMLGRSWSSVWLPLRTSMAFGLIMPAGGDGTFSVAQTMVMYMIIVGSNSGTWLWGMGVEALAQGAPIMATTAYYDSNTFSDNAKLLHCAAVRSHLLEKKDGEEPIALKIDRFFTFKKNEGSKQKNILKYSEIGTIELTNAKAINFDGCGRIDIPYAGSELGGTSVSGESISKTESLNPDTNLKGDATRSWEQQLQVNFDRSVRNNYGLILTASKNFADHVIKEELTRQNIDSALSVGKVKAADMNLKIGKATEEYIKVSKAFDTYVETVRSETVAVDIAENWKARMKKGGWMKAGVWFFEASKIQGYTQALLGSISSSASLNIQENIMSCYFWRSGNCKEQNDEYKSYLAGTDEAIQRGNEMISGSNPVGKDGGEGKIGLTEAKGPGGNGFKENATQGVSSWIASAFMNGLMRMGAGDAKGTGQSNEKVSSENTSGMVSPFTAVSSIGRGLQTISITVWSAGLASAMLIGAEDSGPGKLVKFFLPTSGAALGALKYVMATMVPVLMGIASLAFMLAFAIPFMPITVWIMLVCGYLVTVIEAIAAAPLAVIMLATPEGEGMAGGNFQKALQMINAIMLRPSLSIVGLFASMTFSYVGFSLLNELFWSVANLTTGWFSIFEIMAIIFIYTTIAFKLCEYMVGIIHKIPDQILEWMGGGMTRQFGEDAAEQGVTGALQGGAASGGLATSSGMRTVGDLIKGRAKNKPSGGGDAPAGDAGGAR